MINTLSFNAKNLIIDGVPVIEYIVDCYIMVEENVPLGRHCIHYSPAEGKRVVNLAHQKLLQCLIRLGTMPLVFETILLNLKSSQEQLNVLFNCKSYIQNLLQEWSQKRRWSGVDIWLSNL